MYACGNMSAEVASPYSLKNPFPARHTVNVKLTGAASEKDTRHHEISLAGSGLKYLAGDALGLKATNCPNLVRELLDALHFSGDEIVPTRSAGEKPIRDALFSEYSITFADRKFAEACAAKGASALAELIVPEKSDALRQYLSGRNDAHDYVDILTENPALSFTPEEFVKLLKPLAPRLYSIASSLMAHPEEVHLCVATVRYQIRGRWRQGVASTFMSDRWEGDTKAGVYIQNQQKHFSLPADGNTPMIMVGPGTGVAPFRAFLEERQVCGAAGRNWLIFGEQRRAQDFFYETQFTQYVNDGFLRLDTAFSRDQQQKVYVQHRMTEHGKDIWAWLEEGAEFFVCGDKENMAAAVDLALVQIAQTHGGKSEEEAKTLIEGWKKAKRYKRDVY